MFKTSLYAQFSLRALYAFHSNTWNRSLLRNFIVSHYHTRKLETKNIRSSVLQDEVPRSKHFLKKITDAEYRLLHLFNTLTNNNFFT